MATAVLINLGVGVLFVLIGILASKVASHGRSIIVFFAMGSAMTAACMWILVVKWPVLLHEPIPRLWPLIGCMTAAGSVNALGQILTVLSMRHGHKGLSWAMVQSAMVISFLAGWAIFGDRIGLPGWFGVASILAAIGLLATSGKRREPETPPNTTWLLINLAALIIIGAAQTLMGIPSRWEGWTDVARIRIPISLTAGACVHTAFVTIRRHGIDPRTFKLSLAWVAVSFFSYLGTFTCLDLLAELDIAGVFFPTAIGVCIFGFSIYSKWRLHEHFNARSITGLALTLAGVALLAMA